MRRHSRELALQILFQTEFAPQIPLSHILDLYRSSYEMESSPETSDIKFDNETLGYAQELIEGVMKNKTAIDQKIQAVSQHWKIDRMATIDRNILRIAVFEMIVKTDRLQPHIVINEALEIAKKYGTTDSASFINGVLDQAKKQNS